MIFSEENKIALEYHRMFLISRISEEYRKHGFPVGKMGGVIKISEDVTKDKGKLEDYIEDLKEIAKDVIFESEKPEIKNYSHYVPSINHLNKNFYCLELNLKD